MSGRVSDSVSMFPVKSVNVRRHENVKVVTLRPTMMCSQICRALSESGSGGVIFSRKKT